MFFTLLSLNLGLLRQFGGLLEPVPFVEERFGEIPRGLEKLDADLIVLQEIYDTSHRNKLIRSLRLKYPFVAFERSQRFGLESGLMALSRFPMKAHFEPFRCGPLEERLFVNKGMLVISVETNIWPRLNIVDIHTTAGGVFSLPQDSVIEGLRAKQIAQILRVAGMAATSAPCLIAGDLNAGPTVSEKNYRLLRQCGWVDLHAQLNPGSTECTWDPANSLNRNGPHRMCPPQRIDHIFARRLDIESGLLIPRQSRIVLTEPCISLGTGGRVTLSDHYGVLVELFSLQA